MDVFHHFLCYRFLFCDGNLLNSFAPHSNQFRWLDEVRQHGRFRAEPTRDRHKATASIAATIFHTDVGCWRSCFMLSRSSRKKTFNPPSNEALEAHNTVTITHKDILCGLPRIIPKLVANKIVLNTIYSDAS